MAELHQVKLGNGTYDAVTKPYVDEKLADKQDTLVSGTNIKTVNGESLLGSGDLDVDEIFYITVDGDAFTPTSDPDVYEMELTSPYTLAELNAVLQSENPKSMILRLVSTSGTTKTINEVLLDTMAPTVFEGDLFYTETYMEVSHSYAKFIIANASGKTMLTRRTGRVGGEEHVELTQAEYDALSTEEKNNGKVYFITDGGGYVPAVDIIPHAQQEPIIVGKFDLRGDGEYRNVYRIRKWISDLKNANSIITAGWTETGVYIRPLRVYGSFTFHDYESTSTGFKTIIQQFPIPYSGYAPIEAPSGEKIGLKFYVDHNNKLIMVIDGRSYFNQDDFAQVIIDYIETPVS